MERNTLRRQTPGRYATRNSPPHAAISLPVLARCERSERLPPLTLMFLKERSTSPANAWRDRGYKDLG
jgi:hypothetical protein